VTTDLNAASNRADEINRATKILESKNMIDEASKFVYQILLNHFINLLKYHKTI